MTDDIEHLDGVKIVELSGEDCVDLDEAIRAGIVTIKHFDGDASLPVSVRSTDGYVELPCRCRHCDGQFGDLLGGEHDPEGSGIHRQCEARIRIVIVPDAGAHVDGRDIVGEAAATIGLSDGAEDSQSDGAGDVGRQEKAVRSRIWIFDANRDVAPGDDDRGGVIQQSGEQGASPEGSGDHDA